MTWLGLQEALDRILDVSSDEYRRAQSKLQGAPTEHVDSITDEALGRVIEPILAAEPEFDGPYVLHRENGMSGFGLRHAATTLVTRARRSGSTGLAIAWLQKVLATRTAPGSCFMAVWGIPADQIVSLGRNVRLVPFRSIPDSGQKRMVVRTYETATHVGTLLPTTSLWGVPESALEYPVVVAPFISRGADEQTAPKSDPLAPYTLLDDVRKVLTVVGPSLTMQAASWFQFEDPDLEDAFMGVGVGSSHLEVAPMLLKPLGAFDREQAATLVGAYLGLSGKLKARMSVSLDRLNLAMRRGNGGDQALDVSIALEALLLSDEKGDNKFKTGLRAALLVASDLVERRRVRDVIRTTYDMRSDLVHNGSTSSIRKVAGRGQVPALDVSREAVLICADVIRRLLELGRVPDWSDVELGAGIS